MADTIHIVTRTTNYEGSRVVGIFTDEGKARECYNRIDLWDDQWATMQPMTPVNGEFVALLDCNLEIVGERRDGPYNHLADKPDASELERLCSRVSNCTFTPANEATNG